MNQTTWAIAISILSVALFPVVKPLGWLWGGVAMLVLLFAAGKVLDWLFPAKD